MKLFISIFFISFIVSVNVNCQSLMSPEEFLGYELGTQFTLHHQAVEYFRYIAEKSKLAEFVRYGTTYEGRPLVVCIISDEENLSKMDELRQNNLIKTGLYEGKFSGRQIPFIWLAYNVHGNESTGMETAMKTLYALVSGSFPGTDEWLKSCVIIIDPCQNPDGRDLYANRYRNSQSLMPNPDKNAWEHHQEWPGARTNHYFFDLNRDWIWQTQTETAQRINIYNKYMPHVYADFHEMGPESTFFFAPGAEPWHEAITPWQHEFHKLMGRGNAAMFDEKHKLYFTGETYDLFCPGYGDTWPLFNGSMGFTYEQGGSGYSGIALRMESGDTLTLKNKIDGHFTASMATLKVSFENREKLISEFNKFFSENAERPSFKYKSIIIKRSNERSNLLNLLQLLTSNQIKFSYAGNIGSKFKGFDYLMNKDGEVIIEKGDILISAYQPQSKLIQVLFEPDSRSSDSLAYDLTAWALPYAYNLKAYALNERVKPLDEPFVYQTIKNDYNATKPYGYAINFTGFNELKFVTSLQKKNVKVRYTLKPFLIGNKSYERGSFLISISDNQELTGKIDRILTDEANRLQVSINPVASGLVDKGKDFGSDYNPLIKKVRIGLVCGRGTTAGTVGELWYFLERELEYPVSLLNIADVENINLNEYDVLMLTSGNYSRLKDTIVDYVRKGGRVVAFENAISLFASDKSTALFKAVEARNNELKSAEKKIMSGDTILLRKFENERRHLLSEKSEGSIYKVKNDITNPLAFGLGNEWFILKKSTIYPFLDKGSNVCYILDNEPVSGFAGYKFKKQVKNTLIMGSEKIGSGEAVYITDDPYFRAFWKSGRVLLWNVIFR